MFSAISAIATLTRSGTAGVVASAGWFWLLFFTAVPLLLVCLGGRPTPTTRQVSSGGPPPQTSTTPGTTSAVIDEHRTRQTNARTLTGLATEVAHLRTVVETLAAIVTRHEEQIRRLTRKTAPPEEPFRRQTAKR